MKDSIDFKSVNEEIGYRDGLNLQAINNFYKNPEYDNYRTAFQFVHGRNPEISVEPRLLVSDDTNLRSGFYYNVVIK